MARSKILLSVSDSTNNEEISYVERSLGSKGRDILAIKLALGVLVPAEDIVQRVDNEDFSIGRNWFDCEEAIGVTSMSGVTFDEKLRKKIMNYQIRNQFTILSYYFEKYGIKNVNTNQDLLTQVLQAESIFESEFGNIGEGTIHALHGWSPEADILNIGYNIENQIDQQVPMYFAMALESGAIARPEKIIEFAIPSETGSPAPWYEKAKRDFPRFYRSARDLRNKIDEETGMAKWDVTTSASPLYTASLQVLTAAANEPKRGLDDMSKAQIDALSARAFEPDPKTDPPPFVINYKKIGVFLRTLYDLDSLPTTITAEVLSQMKLQAASSAASTFRKKLVTSAPEIQNKVQFIEFRSPSLRPGDVYRAYLEIDKDWLDSLEDGVTIPSSHLQSISDNLTELLETKLDQVQDALEQHYCAQGGGFDDPEAETQYRKYRAFATKNKKELVRRIRDAAQASLDLQGEVGNNYTFDLGPFGQAQFSDTQIINSATNNILGLIDSKLPDKELPNPGQIVYYYNDLELDINNSVQNLKDAAPDMDNYRVKGEPTFNSTRIDDEASLLATIPGIILSLLKQNSQVTRAASSAGKSVEDLFSPGLIGDGGQVKFSFTTRPDGASNISSISAVLPGTAAGIPLKVQYPLDQPTTVHYLRNLEGMSSNFSGALCNRLGGSQGGMGTRFILKYTRPLRKAEGAPMSEVFHSLTEPATGAVKDYIDENVENASTWVNDSGRPNVTLKEAMTATGLLPANFELSQVLPMLGDNCTFNELADLLGKRLEDMLCNYIECIRLPGFKVKIPNIDIDLPKLPRRPTFSLGFDPDMFLDVLQQIATRLMCRLAKKLIDVLKTPFCGDELIEDLYGAASNSTGPAVRKALADSILDLEVPSEHYDDLGDLVDELSKFLTPREFCRLMQEGESSLEVTSIITRLSSRYNLTSYLSSDIARSRLFSTIGLFLDSKLCEELQRFNDMLGQYTCKDTSDLLSRIRNKIARNEDVSDAEIENAVQLAERNLLDDSMAIEALVNGEGLSGALGGMVAPSSPDNPYNPVPRVVLSTAQTTADLIFEAPKMSYIASLKNFVPSMFLSIPATSQPGDKNYNAEALMKVQRHANNLNLYAQKITDDSTVEGEVSRVALFSQAVEKLKILHYDYVMQDLKGEEVFDFEPGSDDQVSYRMQQQTDAETGHVSETPVLKLDDSGVPIIKEGELFPIKMSTIPMTPDFGADNPPKVIRTSLKFRTQEEFDTFTDSDSGGIVATDDVILGDYIEDINDLVNERLSLMRQEIEQSIEKAFTITDKSKFLAILKDFYDVKLESLRDGTSKELIDYRSDQNSLILMEPEGSLFDCNLIMRDGKSKNKRVPYIIDINDQLFLGKKTTFRYCQDIPEEYNTYGNALNGDFPRKSLFAHLYVKSLAEKFNNYSDVQVHDLSLGNIGLDENQPSTLIGDLYKDVYAKTAEGTMEQLAQLLGSSRLFTNESYLVRLERILRGNSFYDNSSQCIKNKFGQVGLSEISFEKAIVYDFDIELQKEMILASKNPLQLTGAETGPFEKAIGSVVVRAFIRLCILEIVLKSATSFSVWDLEFSMQDEFFKDYVREFVITQIDNNQTFNEYKDEFEESLIRTSGKTNKFVALQTIISEELVKFPKFSKILYDHDSSVEHKNWLAKILPLKDVSPHPEPASPRKHPVPFDELPMSQNCFSYFERYLRLRGPLANPTSLVAARYSAAEAAAGPIYNALRNTNLTVRYQDSEGNIVDEDPNLSDYLVNEESPQLVTYNDQINNKELISPEEFRFLIQDVLFGDEGLNRYFADLLNLVGPDQTRKKYLWGSPQAINRTPARAITRKRKFLKITEYDPFTSNGGRFFEDLYNQTDYYQDTSTQQALTGLLNNNTSEDEDRYYLLPYNYYKHYPAGDNNTYSEMTAEEFLNGGAFGDASKKLNSFLFQSGKYRKFPSPDRRTDDERDFGRMEDIINETAEDGLIRGRGITPRGNGTWDPLDPRRSYFTDTRRTEDEIWFDYYNDGLSLDVYFSNDYGEVKESAYRQHIENVEGSQEEIWQETVIDMVMDAAPIFNLVGNSADPLTNNLELQGNSQLGLSNVIDYIERDERVAMINNQAERTGPGYTFMVRPLEGQQGEYTGQPILADSFGYKRPFPGNMREETLFNEFSTSRPFAESPWSIGEQTVLKRNDYKIPIRILVTQIMDPNGNVLSAFARCEVPEILDFNNSEKDSQRANLLSQAFQKICSDFTNSIESTYRTIENVEQHSEEERSRLSDPQAKFRFVKEKVPDFPVFCRTPNNTLPTGRSVRNSVLSTSKLYSVAAGIEATSNIGNFTMDQAQLDQLFADRGYILKKKNNVSQLKNRQHIRSALTAAVDYTPSNQEAINSWQALADRGQGFGTGPASMSHEGVLVALEDLKEEAENEKRVHIEGMVENIYRQNFIGANDFYARGGLHGILGQSPDAPKALQTFTSLSNIVTWFSQRRSESLWGKTFNVRDPDRNSRMFRQIQQTIDLDTSSIDNLVESQIERQQQGQNFLIDPSITQLPVEESFYRSGNSPFHADGRTYDNQFMEVLWESFNMFNGETTDIESLRRYKVFHVAMVQLRNHTYRTNRYYEFLYGANFQTNQEYIDLHHTFANDQALDHKDFRQEMKDMVNRNNNKAELGALVLPASDGGTEVVLNPTQQSQINFALRYMSKSPYYRRLDTPRSSAYKEMIISDSDITDTLTDDIYLERLRKVEQGIVDFADAPSIPVIKQLFGSKNRNITGEAKKRIYATTAAEYVEKQFRNLLSVKASKEFMRTRYLAGLNALKTGIENENGQQMGITEAMVHVLGSYRDEDSEGNSEVRNAMAWTTIHSGLRLVHTTPREAVSPQTWTNMTNIGYSIVAGNPFLIEERLGPHARPGSESGEDNVWNCSVAEYEREIESLHCWGFGDDLLKTIYQMDDFMMNQMAKSQDYKAYTEICFPSKTYCSMLTVHGLALLGGYNTMPTVLDSTKELISSIMEIVSEGMADQTSSSAFGAKIDNVELKNMLDEGLSSQGLDPCLSAPGLGKWMRIVKEMVEEIVKRFPALVLRGIADQIDPAYREIKRHWTTCELDGFSFHGMDSGQIIAPASGKREIPLGIRGSSGNGTYAPVNLAFPVDLGLSIYKLIWRNDPEYIYSTISKLAGYLGKGSAPFLDPSYAFQIPCMDIDASGDSAFNWDKFEFGDYGRYGHPITIFTLLALSTQVLPGDRNVKNQICVINEEAPDVQDCDDEE